MESCRDSACLNCWGWSNPLEQSHLHGKTWDCIIHAQKSSSKPLPGWPHTSDVLMSHHCSREVFFVVAQKARRFTLIPLITRWKLFHWSAGPNFHSSNQNGFERWPWLLAQPTSLIHSISLLLLFPNPRHKASAASLCPSGSGHSTDTTEHDH